MSTYFSIQGKGECHWRLLHRPADGMLQGTLVVICSCLAMAVQPSSPLTNRQKQS